MKRTVRNMGNGLFIETVKTEDTTCLILDTCVWINLAQSFYSDLLRELLALVYKKSVTIVIPQQVLIEWDRHKESKVTNRLENILNDTIKSSRQIKEFINDEDKKILDEIIEKVSVDRPNIVNSIAEYNLMTIDQIRNHINTRIIEVSPEVKEQALKRALDNKIPFKTNKNSMGDALIILSTLEYLKENKFKEAYFITNNTEDFSNKPNKTEVHDDLKDLFEEINLKYSINIGETINKIEKNSIRNDIVEYINEANDNAPTCAKCNEQMIGYYKRDAYGTAWHHKCLKCNNEINTGEYLA